MLNKKDLKLGNKYFIFDELDEKIDEVILYKFNRDEKGNIISYGLASSKKDESYKCEVKDIKYLFETFEECIEDVLKDYKKIIIKNSK